MATALATESKAQVAQPQGEHARAPPAATGRDTETKRKLLAERGRKVLSQPQRSPLLAADAVQTKGFVSSPEDASEREADRIAAHVVSMPNPVAAPQSRGSAVQRKATPAPPTAPTLPPTPPVPQAPSAEQVAPPRGAGGQFDDADLMAAVRAAASGGFEMSKKTRAFMEPRFGADFSAVRIHTGPEARRLSNRLGARAFTFGRHIFFNDGEYQPDSPSGRQLLAHELTHTIQQREAVQRKAAEAPRVTQHTSRQASRLGISDALDYFAEAAYNIPGYRMFTILIGVNPINMQSVEASAANILRAIVEFLPGGNVITRVLDSYGIFEKVGGWIEGQLKSLGITGSSIRAAIMEFLDSLGWRDIFRLGSVWERAKRIFLTPIRNIITFAQGLFSQILQFVREAVLAPLARLAEGTRFYPLLKAVLGRDPVTGEAVASGPAEIIGGFMTMIGQEAIWGDIQRAKAIPRAWAWFQGALAGLIGLVSSIPERFMDGLRSLEIMDFVVLPRAFAKIAGVFGGFVADFGRWALGTVFDLLQIIVEVVAPGVMVYIRRAAGAFQTIIRNPGRFVSTLIRAAQLGFRQFARKFLTHLQASLVGWLTGAMSGANIYIPQGFNLREILKFVLSVLGLTWQNIRAKLVRATNEATVVALETGFDIVRTLVTEGPAAAWQKILETLSNLKQMAIDAIMDFVKSRVVQAAVTRLLSMLSPAGAFIQAVIATYNTIMFFVERLRQIAQVAAAFIDGIAAIAAGNIGPAANRVEQTMAGLLTLVISFLARIAGLGRVSDAVTNLINRIRAPIDRALDRLVAWIVAQARRLGAAVMGGARRAAGAVRDAIGAIGERMGFSAGGESHRLYVDDSGPRPRMMMASSPDLLVTHLTGFRSRAQGLPNASRGANIVRLIDNQAMPKAREIDQRLGDIAAAAPGAPKVAQYERHNPRIRSLEGQILPVMVQILDGIGTTVPRETRPIAITFTVGPNFTSADRPEFTRQLSLQSAGICAMSIAEWHRNRGTFLARRTASGGRSGRDPASRTLQANERTRVRSALALMLSQPEGSASGRGLTDYEVAFVRQTFAANSTARATGFVGALQGVATSAIDGFMRQQAALHSPDQVAGGLASDLTGVGSSRVNSSIGSSWGNGKAAELETRLSSEIAANFGQPGPTIGEALFSTIRMNIILSI